MYGCDVCTCVCDVCTCVCVTYIHDADDMCVCVYMQKSEKSFRCPLSLSDMFF